jgi:beta-glucanase (GH16 family)
VFFVATLAPPAAAGSTSGVGSNLRYADASAACGGVTGYKPDGTAWQCTFDDEFSGSTLDTAAWTPQLTATSNFTTGPSGAKACYVNTPNNISVANGELDLTVRKESAPFTCGSGRKAFTTQYTSGEVSTYLGFHQQYGKFEIRARLP